jgi:DNA primase
MRLHEAGIPCVATFGDSVYDAQANLLFEHGIEKVILIHDGDEGRRVGAVSSLPTLAKGLFVKTIMLDDGVKPDTMSGEIMYTLPRYQGNA